MKTSPRLFLACLATSLATVALPVTAQEWTSFTVDQLTGFSFGHDHLPDGRFVFGLAGAVSVQTDFGLAGFDPVANPANRSFDPSFVAIRSATEGLIGGGGFFGPSGLYPFDPSAPATAVAPALVTLQNYAATYWRHPSSGREGWLISGGNGDAGGNNLTFVSADGVHAGPVTGSLSAYSGAVASDAVGRVFAVLADFNAAIDNQVLEFSAEQIDGAVAAVIAGGPAPISREAAANPFRADASGAMAVDSLGRLWFGGYQIEHLQGYDPATGVTCRFSPDHAPLTGAAGPPSYAPKAFTRAGESYVSFLANDSYYTADSDLVLGFKLVSEIPFRSVQFTEASRSAREDEGSVVVSVTITPPPTRPVTVSVGVSGSATEGADFTTVQEIVFAAGEATREIPIDLIDDSVARENPETVVLTLGAPSPVSEAGLGALQTERFTLTVTDDEVAPQILSSQVFGPLRVGTAFQHTVTAGGGDATRWSARGLPPGLKIHPLTGEITGIPTAAGEFDRVVIYASNAYGKTVSVVFLLTVDAMPPMVTGIFEGLFDRAGPESAGLGGRLYLVTSSSGAFSGVATIGGRRHRIRGRLDTATPDPTLAAAISHQGTPLTLNATIDAGDGSLTGGIAGGGGLTGWRAVTDSTRSGICHALLAVPGGPAASVPEGTGYGVVRFGKRSTARVLGRLADGSAFGSGGGIGPDGEILIYQPLYRLTGSLLGDLQITQDSAQAVSGDLTWSKAAQAKGTLYRAGWAAPLDLSARGGKYRPVDGATLPLDVLPGDAANASLLLQDGGLDALGANPRTFPVRLVSSIRALMDKPHRLALNNARGTFGGVVTVEDTAGLRRQVKFGGLLVPDDTTANPFDTAGHGYFFLRVAADEVRSGMVLLEPAAP